MSSCASAVLGWDSLNALRKRLLAIRLDPDYPEDLRHKAGAVEEAISRLLEGEPQKTQRLTEESARFDRYYAVPVSLFAFHDVFEQHFRRAQDTERPARESLSEQPFRDLLALYAGALFPLEGLLPLSYEYEAFPFVIFNSYSLPELRGKLFAEKQLFASSELNVLNLILTGQ